jgi:hypothetical protein
MLGFQYFVNVWYVYDQGKTKHTGKFGCRVSHQLKWDAE